MKTTLVAALVGFVLVCSVPTSANQSHLQHRLVRQTDTANCPSVCEGKTDGNVVFIYGNTYIFICRRIRFIIFYNKDAGTALCISLDQSFIALINIKTRCAFIIETSTGMTRFITLEFNVDIDNGSSDAKVLFKFFVDIAGQILVGWKNESLYRFNFYEFTFQLVGGKSIEDYFKDHAEIGASIKTGMEIIIREIVQRVSEGGRNVMVVIQVIIRIAVNIEGYEIYCYNLATRSFTYISDTSINLFISACKEGAKAVGILAGSIDSGDSGNSTIESSRTWTLNFGSVTFIITIKKYKESWTLTCKSFGGNGGYFLIGYYKGFLYIYSRGYLVIFARRLISVWHLKSGSGLIIKNYIWAAIVERSAAIREKWQKASETSKVDDFNSALEEAYNLTISTKIGINTYKNCKNNIITGNNISAKWLEDWKDIRGELIKNRNWNIINICFEGCVQVKSFTSSITSALTAISSLAGGFFSTFANLLCKFILKQNDLKVEWRFEVKHASG